MNNIRMNWLDAARIAAAFCIIAIHSTTDPQGKAFPYAQEGERLFSVLFRTTAELASTEYFILVSLFLLAFKLERKPAGFVSTMQLQARRLLVPFVFWTVFYAFFKLFKATQFGYAGHIWEGLLSPLTWLDYFVLGTSQYHMHFLPTLFILILFHPLYKLAARYPVLGLSLIPLLFMRDFFAGWLWANVGNYDVLEYLVRAVKILCYVGYGMAAYALFGWWQQHLQQAERALVLKLFALSAFALSMLFMIKLIQATQIIASGDFGLRSGAFYYAHYLIPVFSLLMFMSSQHFNWPDKLSLWSKYTFAMYLVHPAVIDVFDVLVRSVDMVPWQYTVAKYLFAAAGALAIAVLLGRIAPMAWTVGLGPLPFSAAYKKLHGKTVIDTDSGKAATA